VPAEVFDPESGQSKPTSAPPYPLGRGHAVALESGHVLWFAADEAGTGKPVVAYFVEDDSWIEAGRLLPSRFIESATEVEGGHVLLIGIEPSGRSRVELWNPPAMKAVPTGQLGAPRPGHAATNIGKGRVLVSGGWIHDAGRFAGVHASTEIWDAATKRWSPGAPMKQSRHHHQATRLLDGRVLLSGGADDGPDLEVWDPKSDAWTAIDARGVAPKLHTATRLGDGSVLLVGGATPERFGPVHLFDPKTMRLHALERLSTARAGHAATLLGDGRVLVTGGADSSGALFDTAELFDPTAGAWSPAGTLVAPRSRHTATPLDDGRLLLAGGASRG
jgi:hypothetical protein